MNFRTLGGPLFAFASAAVMLGVIAVLAALLLRDGSTFGSKDDDFILGEYGRVGPMPEIKTKPLESEYPFSAFLNLPSGTKEAILGQERPSQQRTGDPWFGQFVLQEPTQATIAAMRDQVEVRGLKTGDVQGTTVGFSFSGTDVEGLVQLYEFPEKKNILGVILVRYPEAR
jgi:hypothetical protein